MTAKKKPKSMIAHAELIPDTIEAALCGRQLQPVIRSPFLNPDGYVIFS